MAGTLWWMPAEPCCGDATHDCPQCESEQSYTVELMTGCTADGCCTADFCCNLLTGTCPSTVTYDCDDFLGTYTLQFWKKQTYLAKEQCWWSTADIPKDNTWCEVIDPPTGSDRLYNIHMKANEFTVGVSAFWRIYLVARDDTPANSDHDSLDPNSSPFEIQGEWGAGTISACPSTPELYMVGQTGGAFECSDT